MVRAFEDPTTWTAAYADRVRDIIGILAAGLKEGHQPDRDILLFAAHLHVEGAIVTNSERPYTVSEGYATHASALPPVSYAAFGHIHRSQKLPQASVTGYYAGSPIQLDFGEEHDSKVCLLVEADPGGAATITEHAYDIVRPLRRFDGRLEDLQTTCDGAGTCLAQVIVHTDEPAQELAAQVRELLPDAVLLDVIEVCAAQQQIALTASDQEVEGETPVPVLFSEYVSGTGVQASTVPDVLDTFRALFDAGDALPELPELLADTDEKTSELAAS
jgi:exonuclease SbcD